MDWEDGFKEYPQKKDDTGRYTRLSDHLVVTLTDTISKEIEGHRFKSVDHDVTSGIIASALIRILLGTSLHGLHCNGLYREIESEEELVRNTEVFGLVVEHVVSTLGGTLDSIDEKHAHSIHIIRKEKP